MYVTSSIIDEDEDPFDWWKKNGKFYPSLARVARNLLAIQTGGRDVEGIFSMGRKMLPYNRNRLKPLNFKAQMLVNGGVKAGLIEMKLNKK